MNMYRMAMTVKYLWRVSKKKRREGLTKSGECEFCSIMGRLRCKGCYCWYCSPVCQVRHQPVHTPACQPSQKTLQALILPDGSRYARSIGRGGAANLETGFSFLPNNYVKEVKRRISDLKHEPLSEVPCGWIVTEQTHKYRMCKLKFQRTRGLKAIKAIKSHDNYQDSYILLNLPHILERTKETDEQVRRAASKFLAGNVHIKSLTMGQREGVLDRGLGEKSEAMRRVVEKMIPLLPAIQDEEVMRAKQLQIVKLRVELNLLRDQLVESVTGKNFLIAQQIKVQMVRLKEEQAMMEDQLSTSKAIGAAPPASASPIDPTPAAAAAATAAQLDLNDYAAPVLDNPAVTLKCLRLLVASLQDPSIIQLNSTLLTLLDMVSVQSELPAIRKEAITAMACCCLGSLENVRQHMLLLLQAAHIDVHEVRITAIIALVDLLMKHGLSSFITQEESDLDVSGGNSSADRLISHINIDMAMESELPTRGGTLTQLELRTEVAEGLCKLLVIGSINNPKLLSNLLLIWYNPMTESDSKLRHILGIFFPLYSSMSKPHQLAMEAAFIPTMRVLFDAPVPSPLNEIDTEDVGMFFVHLTREDMLHTFDANKKDINIFESSSTTTTVHDSLALSVCHGILSSPDSFQTKVLIKILTSLALTHNNYVHLKELKVLAELLLQNVKEKSCVRTLERFDKQLMDWMAKDPATNINDTPRANKRKSKGGADESPDESGTLTPTRSKKRILFSQSMIVNPLPNPESGHILETTSEEDVLTTLGDESLGISPMVVGNTRVDRCSQELDVEKTMVKNVFPLWIFSSHSIVFGVRKLFYVVTKTTLKLKKLFVGWILKERDGNFDLLRAGDVESNPGPGGYDVEQTIKIDGNAPKEIYYYQQISSRVLQMFNSPWGVVMKNCQADGKLVDFSNMAAFETFRKEERKQMWLHLPLKVFQINSNVLMGVFVCPECPSMAGMMEQEAAQDSVSIIKCLCMHSRVATMRIGDWRKEWTVSMSPSNLTFYVNHEEDANCVVLIPKSSKTAFLAAVLSKSKVYLLYCATVRQDLPFCSHCTTRKCCHYSSLVGFESSHAPNPAGEGEEENYEPLHDVEENDLNYNEHYMKKPPIHVRGSMYGYNFEEIIYPFSESPEQQRVWLQRVAGLVSIPPRLEPTVDNESKCKHNMPYNNRSDALVVESKTVCLFNDIGERIISSEVFARPSLGPCKCLKRFDGNKHLIWHLGGGRFVDYSTLHSYLHKWRSSGMAMYSLYRSIVDGAESCGISCSLTYSDIHRAVSGFFVNLVFNVHKAFRKGFNRKF